MGPDLPNWLDGVSTAILAAKNNKRLLEANMRLAAKRAERERVRKIDSIENDVFTSLDTWNRFKIPELLVDVAQVIEADHVRHTIIGFEGTDDELSFQGDSSFHLNNKPFTRYDSIKDAFHANYPYRVLDVESTKFSHIVGRVFNIKPDPYSETDSFIGIPLFSIYLDRKGWSVAVNHKKSFLGNQNKIKNPEILRKMVGKYLADGFSKKR